MNNMEVNHIEVEWLDSEGCGHHIEFSATQDEQVTEFIKAIEGVAIMIAAYKVYKERM